MTYLNGDVVTVDAYVLFYGAQWQVTATPLTERHTFSCTGKIIKKGKDEPQFHVQGIIADRVLPSIRDGGRPSKKSVLEPLRLSMEARLGVVVRPFKMDIIQEGDERDASGRD